MENVQQVNWMVWGAMLFSLAVYACIPLLVVRPPKPVWASFVGALAAISMTTAIATAIVRNRALVRPARVGRLDLSSQSGANRLQAISIINWALSNSIGVYGLVCFLLFGSYALLAGFVAVAVALILYHAPRLSPLQPAPSAELLASRPEPIG